MLLNFSGLPNQISVIQLSYPCGKFYETFLRGNSYSLSVFKNMCDLFFKKLSLK